MAPEILRMYLSLSAEDKQKVIAKIDELLQKQIGQEIQCGQVH